MRRLAFFFEDLLQDERDAGRLADAGRAEDGEMLAQQLVEIDVGRDGIVELQPTDLDGFAAGDAVDDGAPSRVSSRRILSPMVG